MDDRQIQLLLRALNILVERAGGEATFTMGEMQGPSDGAVVLMRTNDDGSLTFTRYTDPEEAIAAAAKARDEWMARGGDDAPPLPPPAGADQG